MIAKSVGIVVIVAMYLGVAFAFIIGTLRSLQDTPPLPSWFAVISVVVMLLAFGKVVGLGLEKLLRWLTK